MRHVVMTVVLAVVGLIHGTLAVLIFTSVLDHRSRSSRMAVLKMLLAWWPLTLLAMLPTSFHFGSWLFFPCTAAVFLIGGIVALIGRPRRVQRDTTRTPASGPLRQAFEHPGMKGAGVVLCAVGAVLAVVGAPILGTVVAVCGTFMWGGADVVAGWGSLVAAVLDDADD